MPWLWTESCTLSVGCFFQAGLKIFPFKHQSRSWRPPNEAVVSHLSTIYPPPSLFLALATLTVYLLWRTYYFGGGNHDDLAPYILHLLNPDILASDWLVSTLSERIGHRTGVIWLLSLPARLVGLPVTFGVGYVLSWFFMAGALYQISFNLNPDRIAATGTVVAAMLLTPFFTLGSNDLVIPQFTGSTLAWTLSLWSIVMYQHNRPAASGLILGITACLQALIGLQVALIIGLMMVWSRQSLRNILIYGIVFTMVAMVGVAPMVVQHWGSEPTSPSMFYLIFEFRAPHHYIPTQFVLNRSIQFGVLLLMGIISLFALDKEQRVFPVRMLVIIGVVCLASFLGVEVFRSEFIGKLQLFKLTVIAKTVLVVAVCSAISRYLPEVVKRALDPFYKFSHYTFTGVAVVTIVLVLATPDALGFKPPPVTENSPAQEQVTAWARTSTPVNAVFATPPSWNSFRTLGERSIVVNFLAFPFVPEEIVHWYERLLDMAPINVEDKETTGSLLPKLDEAFFSLSSDALRERSQQYGFDYVVRRGAFEAVPADFEEVYSAKELVVYRIIHH